MVGKLRSVETASWQRQGLSWALKGDRNYWKGNRKSFTEKGAVSKTKMSLNEDSDFSELGEVFSCLFLPSPKPSRYENFGEEEGQRRSSVICLILQYLGI